MRTEIVDSVILAQRTQFVILHIFVRNDSFCKGQCVKELLTSLNIKPAPV